MKYTNTNVRKVQKHIIERMDDQNVLITGGLGFIGSNLAHHMVKLGANVTIYDALLPTYGGNLANIKEIKDEIVDVRADMRDFDSLKEQVKDQDVIFHCAAQVSHIESMSDPWTDIDINCRGTINLLEAARRFNDDVKIVYAGTRSQVGKMEYSPIDEKHPEFPTDIYSSNKSIAEKYHLIYHRAYGIPTTSLRISNTYGPRAQIRQKGYGIINYFIRMAILNEVITVYEPGTQTRDCIHVDDVVDAMILAAQSKKADGEVFFVGSGRDVMLIDLVKIIIKIAGNGMWKFVPWPSERKSIEVGDVALSIEKIQRVLGWYPKTTLEEGLEKTYKWIETKLREDKNQEAIHLAKPKQKLQA
jgi:UDP-glucose 4-epimerase